MFLLFIILLYSQQSQACPDTINKICICEEVFNGINLDCSNSSGYDTLKTIRSNQALLGLIQSLTLNNVGFSDLSSKIFAGLYIKKLDLSFNNISMINKETFAEINPILEDLSIKKNTIEKIPFLALLELPNLQKLDLSYNSIKNIPPGEMFPYLKKLNSVDLSHNSILSIHANVFQNVKNSIQMINLGHNNLSTVPSSAIRGLKLLKSLHLHRNNIFEVDALSFLNLPFLSLLNLAENSIQDLNRQAFLNVPSLRYLYLSGNQISQLHDHQFQSFENIEMIDLTRNNISIVPKLCFADFKFLRQLYLGQNLIETIETNAFKNSSIVVLVLSENMIKTIHTDFLSGMYALQQLSFRGNQIEIIEKSAFQDLTSLVMLDLAKNRLHKITPSTFFPQLSLIFVDLSENQLLTVPYNAFNTRVGTILLKGNPLVCIEKIHILQNGNGVYLKDQTDDFCDQPVLNSQSSPFQKQVPKLQIHKNPPVLLTTPNNINAKNTKEAGKNNMTSVQQIFKDTDLIAESTQAGTVSSESLSNKDEQRTEQSMIFLPLPVPFLKRIPPLSKSFIAQNSIFNKENNHTLPPSILINPGSTPLNVVNKTKQNVFNKPLKEQSLLFSGTNEKNLTSGSIQNHPSLTVMMVSVIFAVVVLLIVIIGLCILKQRSFRALNRPNKCLESLDGASISYINHVQKAPIRVDETPSWIYNPGLGYCNYYK